MSESTRDLLIRGIAAAKAGDKDEARFFLEWVLRMNPTPEQERDALFYLSEVADDPAAKRGYLEDILARNPYDPAARRSLAILDGRLKPEDIVDPDRLPRADATPQTAQARRFTCAKCGARMAFAPDGSLRCAFCGSRAPVEAARPADAGERDLLLTLATAQGHARPVAQQVVHCAGCGAEFALPPEALSCACPFCGSALAVQRQEARELIPPDSVIPFVISRDDARACLQQWLRAEGLDGMVEPPVGFYLPVWAFHAAGEVTWRGEVRQRGQAKRVVSGRHSAMQFVMVPAARRLPADLSAVVDTFRTEDAAAYDPRYLADWPAETYEIPVSDASLEARRIVLARLRHEIVNLSEEGFQPESVVVSPLGLAVESFRLVLVPVWLAHFICDGERFAAAVNGQTGEVLAQRPLRGIARWLKGLLG